MYLWLHHGISSSTHAVQLRWRCGCRKLQCRTTKLRRCCSTADNVRWSALVFQQLLFFIQFIIMQNFIYKTNTWRNMFGLQRLLQHVDRSVVKRSRLRRALSYRSYIKVMSARGRLNNNCDCAYVQNNCPGTCFDWHLAFERFRRLLIPVAICIKHCTPRNCLDHDS